MNKPTWSTSVGVHCGACGADLGDQHKPGDGATLFKAHIPNCPKGGDPDARSDFERLPAARTSPPSHAREVVVDTAFGPVRRVPAYDAASWSQQILASYLNARRSTLESVYGPSRHGHRLPPTVEQVAEFEAWKTEYQRLQEDGYAAGWLRSGYEPDEIAEPLGEFVYDEPEEDYVARRAEWEAQQPKGDSVAIPVMYAPVRYER